VSRPVGVGTTRCPPDADHEPERVQLHDALVGALHPAPTVLSASLVPNFAEVKEFAAEGGEEVLHVVVGHDAVHHVAVDAANHL
jgi:hypothetical protein